MRTTFALAVATALAGPAWITMTAAGTVDNFCRVTISPNSAGGTGPYDYFVTQPGVIDLSGSATGGGNSSGSARPLM